MTKDEALKMAIEALEQYIGVVQHKVNAETWGDIEDGGKPAIKAIQACKEALEQPAQIYQQMPDGTLKALNIFAPSWQGLNDDEIQEELKKMWDKGVIPSYSIVAFARAIEQALKDKNS